MTSPAHTHVPRIGVLFVCLGNICRSPLARALFDDMARRRGVAHRFDIDSCGTGDWHTGSGADPRTIAVALKNGLRFDHTARQLHPPADFPRFHVVLAMDRSNRRNILHAGETHALAPRSLHLMRAFDPTLAGAPEHELDVPDPYYGGPEGFQHMHDMLTRACDGLLDHLLRPSKP
jgi:protein-tyrosine phosphatase